MSLFLATTAVRADTVTVYSAGPKLLATELANGFTKKTGIEVILFQSGSTTIMDRYNAEKEAPAVDVIITASWNHALRLDEANELLAYTSPNAENIPSELKSDTYVAQGSAVLAIAYNKKNVDIPPTDWTDLADAEYKDMITMADPVKSGMSSALLHGLVQRHGEGAWLLFDDLFKNGMTVPGGNSAALTPVIKGNKTATIGAVDYVIYNLMSKNPSKLGIVHPESGTVQVFRPILIPKSANNPEGAKRFVDYVLSAEGQKLVADSYILPARNDVKPKRPPASDFSLIEFDRSVMARRNSEVRGRFSFLSR